MFSIYNNAINVHSKNVLSKIWKDNQKWLYVPIIDRNGFMYLGDSSVKMYDI